MINVVILYIGMDIFIDYFFATYYSYKSNIHISSFTVIFQIINVCYLHFMIKNITKNG